MLKTLIGHWKSHRKKPSLLPEDGDVHFADPSKINPLFEDSDSSISSIKLPQSDSSEEQKQTETKTCEQTPIINNVPIVNELVDVSVPTSSSEVIQSKSSVLKDDVEIPEKDNAFIESNSILESENLNHETSVDLERDDVNLIPFESSEKETSNILAEDEVKDISAKTEGNMRILHQPSPSAIFNAGKKSANQVPDENKEKPLSASSIPTEDQNAKKYQNKKENVSKTKSEILKNSDKQPTAQSSQNAKENFSQSTSSQSNGQSEKPLNLKAKAIDELIKKFQGPVTNDNKVAGNTQKPEKKDLVSVPERNNKAINNNIAEIKGKDSFRIPKSAVKQEVSNKNSLEKEALANIFKFPPPPPLENVKKNESSLHGRILPKVSMPSSSSISTPNNTTDNKNVATESEQGKTRSDSSLDRTKTASSKKAEVNSEKTTKEHQTESTVKASETRFNESFLHSSNLKRNLQVKTPPLSLNDKYSKKSNDVSDQPKNIKEDTTHTSILENTRTILPDAKISESEPIVSNDKIAAKKEFIAEKTEKDKPKSTLNKSQPVLSEEKVLAKAVLRISDPKVEASTSFSSANVTQPKDVDVPAQKLKSSISKGSVRINLNTEAENVKSHSEDSGITRGDQISSETTQDASPSNPPEESKTTPNSAKKNKKEKKLKSISKKHSKNCRRNHNDNTSLKRGQYDDYYDILTGVRHAHRNKHSDSMTSDLSWEERELLRRLRSRRGTVRSNTPSTRSRHSRHRFIDENHFRRPHNFRRSISDDSTFFGSSLCSCDECWAQYMKAYERASLRGMPPIHQMCTCQIPRNNFMGRRVKFRSDPIPEVSPSEKTTRTTTPAPTTDSKKEEDNSGDDKSSEKSSHTKDNDSVQKNPNGGKEKKLKFSEEAFRIMTPWELEEWDYLMKKQLLKKRRRRARYMGIMALAMVVFVGLVVAILMVYLRRKVL